jgi:hypothetical protein
MRTRLFFFVIALLATSAVLAQAYRWIDEDGIVHYSDKPSEGAERIILPSDNRVVRRQRAAQAPAAARPGGDQQAAPAPFAYDSLTVVSPAAEETLWNIEGVLNVNLDIRPALQSGHRVRVYFDGNEQMVSGPAFQIEEVYRGVHNLQAEVVDATGKLMIRSVPNRFYVQQNTIKK